MRYAPGRWLDRWVRDEPRQFEIGSGANATDAAADNCVAAIWNPSSTRSMWATGLWWERRSAAPTADPQVKLVRTSTIGTPGLVTTLDLDSDYEREISPATVAEYGRANYSAEPTIQGPPLAKFPQQASNPANQGVYWIFPGRGIRIRPGTGLALVTGAAVATTNNDITFVLAE